MTGLVAAIAAKCVLLLLGAFGAAAGLSGAPAAARHRLWSWVLASLLVLPLAQALVPPLPVAWRPHRFQTLAVPASTPHAPRSLTVAFEPSVLRTATLPLTGSRSFPWGMVLLGIWCAGAALFLARLLADLMRLRRLLAEARPAVDEELAGLARRVGLSRPVAMRVSAAIDIPQACGAFRHHILLPPAADVWPPERRRLVLLHELAHHRRADCFWLLVAHVAVALYWWNPLVRMAASRQDLAGEQACDAAVVAIAAADGIPPQAYAGHLVAIARALVAARVAAPLATAVVRGTALESRVYALLSQAHRPSRPWMLAPFAMLASAAFLPWAPLTVASAPAHAVAARQQPAAPAFAAASVKPGRQSGSVTHPLGDNTVAQSPASFDAASVKSLGPSDGVHIHENSDPSHLSFSGSLHDIIVQAYGLRSPDQLLDEPAWFNRELYAITAVTAQATTDGQKMAMLRTLLAARFQLRLRPEERDFPTYSLVVAPGGPKFRELRPGEPEPPDPDETEGTFARSFDSVGQLLDVLNHVHGGRVSLDRPVVDRTGLTGRYAIVLRTEVVILDDGTPQRRATTPDITHDMESELGLRLVPAHNKLPCYVVLGAARPQPD